MKGGPSSPLPAVSRHEVHLLRHYPEMQVEECCQSGEDGQGSQELQSYKHDIAERLVSTRDLLDSVLTTDPDGQDLLRRSYHCKTNPVKMMHKVIDHCLETEERAERLIWALRDSDYFLYEDLASCRPLGKFARKEPPVVQVTEKARAALGDKIHDLHSVTLLPSYNRRITRVMPALDVLMQYGQLLPEEHAEFWMNSKDTNAKIRLLEEMCRDTSIPEINREFISLVVSSIYMHVFDIPTMMSMNDVLVFAQ